MKNILIICNEEDKFIFKNYLNGYNCIYLQDLSKTQITLKKIHFDYLLLYTDISFSKSDELILNYISDCFPNIYSVAVLKKNAIRLSHFLGKAGIKEIIQVSEIDTLNKLFNNISCTRINLSSMQIEIVKYPAQFQRILKFIEKNYLTIFTISDISNYIGLNECTITREFQKFGLCSPKRLLMNLKVMHSIELLKNTDLRIKEIASLSGFTNEQRYIECFLRIYKCSPSELRIHLKIKQVEFS